MTLIVRPPGLTLYGDDYHGHGFHIVRWAGVMGEVDIDRDVTPRATAHGVFPAKTYGRKRRMPAAGFLVARSFPERTRLLERLNGLVELGEFALPVEFGQDRRWVLAHLEDYPEVDAATFVPEATWSLEFVADDPRVFGDTASFSGSPVTVLHRGLGPAIPEITVAGPVTGPYSITSQGKTITVTQSLTSGQTHRIDMRNGWVYRNGALQTGVLSKLELFTIPAGSGVVVSGPASMTVTVTDTWNF